MADNTRNRPWFPRSSRNFSLGNLSEDVTDWYYQSQNAAEERARLRAMEAINPQLDLRESDARYRANPTRDPDGYIEAAVKDADSRTADDLKSQADMAAFGKPFQRPKMDKARLAGQQQAYLMEQMLAAYGKPVNGMFPAAWRQLPENLSLDLYAYATNQDGYRDRLNSSTEYTGVLGESSPVNTAFTWGQSLPAMIYGAGENIGNAADYGMSKLLGSEPALQFPDAGKNLAYAANTLTAPGQAIAEGIGYAPPIEKGHSAWSDMRDTRKDFDDKVEMWHMGYAKTPYGTTPYEAMQYGSLSDEAQSVKLQEGKQYLEGQRVPEWLAGPLGMALDDLFNPLLDAPGIAAASKAKSFLPLAKQIGIEFAPGQVATGIGLAAQLRAKQLAEEQAKQEQLIGRLR
jgi:hypothetical protein